MADRVSDSAEGRRGERDARQEYRDPVGRRERARESPTAGPPRPGVAEFAVPSGGEAAHPGTHAQNAYAAEWLAVRLRRFRVLNPHAPVPAEFQSITTRPPAPSRLGGYLEARVLAVLGAIRNLFHHVGRHHAARAAHPSAPAAVAPPNPDAYPFESLSGLAFSGGGIRSATFCLGVLQALGERKLLHMFDFFSTVSGGGYVGGWWSAWLSRRSSSRPAPGPQAAIEIPQTLFPADERLEPDRHQPLVIDPANPAPSTVPVSPSVTGPDGSISVALQDPIHHLRLFSNYLTPRKGLLSADTWHAITTVARNLVLTWLVLLPLLLALVTLAQLDFTADPAHASEFASVAAPLMQGRSQPSGKKAIRDTAAGSVGAVVPDTSHQPPRTARDSAVRDSVTAAARSARLDRAMTPAVLLLMWCAAAVVLWLLYSTGTLAPTLFGLVALAVMIMLLVPSSGASGWIETLIRVMRGTTDSGASRGFVGERHPLSLTLLVGLWGMAIVTVVFGALLPFVTYLHVKWTQVGQHQISGRSIDPRTQHVGGDPSETTRNQLVRLQSVFLMVGAAVTLALVVAGFSHEAYATLVGPGGTLPLAAAKAGGWGAFVLATASSLYAVVKATPTVRGGADDQPSSTVGKAAFAVAPISALIVLGAGFATLSHWLLVQFGGSWKSVHPIAMAALVGLAIMIVFAAMESYSEWSAAPSDPADAKVVIRRLEAVSPVVLAIVAFAVVMFVARPIQVGVSPGPQTLAWLIAGSLAVAVFRLVTTKGESGSLLDLQLRGTKGVSRGVVVAVAVATALLVWLALVPLVASWMGAPDARTDGADIAAGAFVALVGAATLVVSEFVAGFGDRSRSVGLAAVAMAAASLLLIVHFLPDPARRLATFDVSMAIALVAAVIALGWMIDPNLLSLHSFYKARLVRAYLGASNATFRKGREITQSAPEDDIPLSGLANAERGAPIHLINTTLNLVGARDLATAQRSSAPFIMSQLICGSMRTGYRETNRYMGNTLTLGTAIATSGAAVSPNMGSRTQSAALSLLMGLFNVRLGLWAPTPDRRRWFERQTRLWPIYLLREALSQTNALGTYCYLTDGGHFDNTGIYALVERACRFIMMVDAGQDTVPCFSDVGEAIRLCRIDFGAEIDLPIGVEAFGRAKKEGTALGHFVSGTIRYSDAHLEMLGYPPEVWEKARLGRIIWVKPSITKEDSVDIRQYRIEAAPFPQQTTADQWFDEAQFESYRALGYQSLSPVLDRIREVGIAPLAVEEWFNRMAGMPSPPAAGPVPPPSALEDAVAQAMQARFVTR